MLIHDALYPYLLKPTSNIKVIVLILAALGFWLRGKPLMSQFYANWRRASVTKSLAVILFLGFCLRFFWILWSPHIPPAQIIEDKIIVQHAQDLAEGRGYVDASGQPTALRPIGYPLFLAALFKMFGVHLFLAEFSNVIFGVVLLSLVFILAKMVFGPAVGILSAVFLCFYPTSIMAAKLIGDEHLFLVLWFCGMIALISDYKKPSIQKVFWAGIILGVSAVVRTYSVIMPAAAFMAWWIGKHSIQKALTRAITVGLLMLAVALPWGIRNQMKLGKPILYTTLLGIHLYYANNSASHVRYGVNPDLEHGGDPKFINASNEIARDMAGRRAAFRWIKGNPLLFIEKAIGRLIYMLGVNNEGWVVEDNFIKIRPGAAPVPRSTTRFLEKAETFYYAFVFLFAVLGMILGFYRFPKGNAAIYIFYTLGFYLLVTAIALNHRKYRFAVEPFFCILAAATFFQLFFGPSKIKTDSNP